MKTALLFSACVIEVDNNSEIILIPSWYHAKKYNKNLTAMVPLHELTGENIETKRAAAHRIIDSVIDTYIESKTQYPRTKVIK